MSESNSRGAFYAGLLLGGLVGAAAALLMTPQPGRQTRLQIQTKGSEFQSQLGDVTSRLQISRGQGVPCPLFGNIRARDHVRSQKHITLRLALRNALRVFIRWMKAGTLYAHQTSP
jgi:gas vesicle protein